MKSYVLGTSVKFTSIVSVIPESIVITVKDSDRNTIIDKAAMSQQSDNLYQYIFQSNTTMTAGDFVAVIEAVSLGNTSVVQIEFTMEKQA